jgi:hypothetical protein
VAGVAVALTLSAATPSAGIGTVPGSLTFVALGPSAGHTRIVDVNAAGTVLGTIYVGGSVNPVLWRRLDTTTALPFEGWRLNDRGDVLGEYAYWRANDETVHPIVHPTLRVYPSDINDNRQVTGNLGSTAFRWQDGVFEQLPTPAASSSTAWRINGRGDVIGTVWTTARLIPVLWRDGAMIDLTPPGGRTGGARDINDAGQVIVNSDAGAFVWNRGRMTKLPVWRGGGAQAWDINNVGDVVGEIDNTPVLWRGGKIIRLGLTGWTGRAAAVNDRGDVAGALLLSGDGFWMRRAFLWRQGRTYYSRPIEGDEVTMLIVGMDGRGRIAGEFSDASTIEEGGVWLVPLGRRPWPR